MNGVSAKAAKVGDKVVLIIKGEKLVGKLADGVSIFAPALLFCLEPQKGKSLEECVLKSPGGKIEEGKSIIQTAQEELEQELGIYIVEENKFQYLKSISSSYNNIEKKLHLVVCDIGNNKINIDNARSEKKVIIGSEGQEEHVNLNIPRTLCVGGHDSILK